MKALNVLAWVFVSIGAITLSALIAFDAYDTLQSGEGFFDKIFSAFVLTMFIGIWSIALCVLALGYVRVLSRGTDQ